MNPASIYLLKSTIKTPEHLIVLVFALSTWKSKCLLKSDNKSSLIERSSIKTLQATTPNRNNFRHASLIITFKIGNFREQHFKDFKEFRNHRR